MPPPLRAIRPTILGVAIPEDLRQQLDDHLFSPAQGRVPKGAYTDLICGLLRQYFSNPTMDLNPYLPGTMPGEVVISGTPDSLEALRRHLEKGAHA